MATLLRYIICPVGGFSPSLWKIWSGQLGWMEIPNMWKVIKTMFHYWLLYPIISHEKNTNKNPIKSHVPVTTNQITIIFPLLLVYSLLTTITINHQPGYPIWKNPVTTNQPLNGTIMNPIATAFWIQTCVLPAFSGGIRAIRNKQAAPAGHFQHQRGTIWLWLTVRHGIDGPNRNSWFTY